MSWWVTIREWGCQSEFLTWWARKHDANYKKFKCQREYIGSNWSCGRSKISQAPLGSDVITSPPLSLTFSISLSLFSHSPSRHLVNLLTSWIATLQSNKTSPDHRWVVWLGAIVYVPIRSSSHRLHKTTQIKLSIVSPGDVVSTYLVTSMNQTSK